MSQNKKQEGEYHSQQKHKPEDSPKSHPFSSYVQSNQPQSKHVTSKVKKSSSKSSSKGKERSSRSRSREIKHREQIRPPRYYAQYDGNYRKDRDRFVPNRGFRRDEIQDQSHFKTRICPLFQKGLCKKGEGCNFAHGQKELRGLPNFKKTRLCIPFKNGQCYRTSGQCNYAHGQAQLKKLVYDYFPQKNPSFNPNRNDRNFREGNFRQRDGDRGRFRNRYDHPRDYGKEQHYPGHQGYPNGYPYPPQFNNPYMFPPGNPSFGPPGEIYPPPSQPNGANQGQYPPNPQNLSSMQNQTQFPPHPYYMGPNYESNYGYLPQNYTPFNSSSNFFLPFLFGLYQKPPQM